MTQPLIKKDQLQEVDVIQVSSSYNVSPTDEVLVVDASGGDVDIFLHAVAESRPTPLHIKRVDSGPGSPPTVVTVYGAGSPSELVDNSSSTMIVGQYTNLTIIPDASNDQWWII